MDEGQARIELQALTHQGMTIASKIDAAIERRDMKTVDGLLAEFTAILARMADIRIELGEGGELLNFVENFAAQHGIDLTSLIGSANVN